MNLLRRFWRWLVGRSLEQVVFEHWVPPYNSVEGWDVGERCYYCLTHVNDKAFDRPCPRRRAESVELA